MIHEKLISSIENPNGTTSAKYTARNINIMFVLSIVIGFSIIGGAFAYFTPTSEYEDCIQTYEEDVSSVNRANKLIQKSCIKDNEDNPHGVNDCMSNSLVPMPVNSCENTGTGVPFIDEPPTNNLRKKFGLEDCRATNDFHRIGRLNLEWMAYDIACDVGKSFDVKSPSEYTIEKIGYGNNLGNYIILKKSSEVGDEETRIVLGHINTSRLEGEKLGEGDVIGQVNISGASTNYHIHIELWDGYTNVSREFALGEKYRTINGTALLNYRQWDFGQQLKDVYYFTNYDLGDVSQNDSTPCIGASGKDLCYLEKTGVSTMALTSDIRTKLGIKFGDKVRLLGDEGCEGVFQVEDEMNKRFRETPGILRPNTPYYIKGDLPSKKGGVCSVTKI